MYSKGGGRTSRLDVHTVLDSFCINKEGDINLIYHLTFLLLSFYKRRKLKSKERERKSNQSFYPHGLFKRKECFLSTKSWVTQTESILKIVLGSFSKENPVLT